MISFCIANFFKGPMQTPDLGFTLDFFLDVYCSKCLHQMFPQKRTWFPFQRTGQRLFLEGQLLFAVKSKINKCRTWFIYFHLLSEYSFCDFRIRKKHVGRLKLEESCTLQAVTIRNKFSFPGNLITLGQIQTFS